MSRTGKFFVIMRIDLKTDPSVLRMACELKQRPEVVVGYLHSIWGWFAQSTDNGIVHGVSIQALEVATNLHDFPQLMEKVGWLKEWKSDKGVPSLEIPNWERWFGGAETRKEYERERKRAQRRKSVPDIVPDNDGTSCGRFAPTGTGTGTNTEASASVETSASPDGRPKNPTEFFSRWNAWVKKHGKGRIKSVVKLTDARKKKINIRLKDAEWWKSFLAALEKLPLPGDGWQPDLEWIVKNDENIYRIIEGKYDWRSSLNGKAEKDSVPVGGDLPVWKDPN